MFGCGVAPAGDERDLPEPLDLAMAMSLVASTRGIALLPAYAKNFLPWSVVSRPLEGVAPTIDLVIGYSNATHRRFLSPVCRKKSVHARPSFRSELDHNISSRRTSSQPGEPGIEEP